MDIIPSDGICIELETNLELLVRYRTFYRICELQWRSVNIW